MKLVVTIPAASDGQDALERLVSEIPRDIPGVSRTDVIVLDDGWSGHKPEIAAAAVGAGATLVTLRGRRGPGAALRAGIGHAIRAGADVVVTLDAGGQFDPRDVSKLIRPILRDEADLVTCSRFGQRENAPPAPAAAHCGDKAVTWLINRICGLKLTDVSCPFRAYNREAAYRLAPFGRSSYLEESLIGLAGKGLRIAEVPLRVRDNADRRKIHPTTQVIRHGTNLVQIVFRAARDVTPMKVFGALSALLVVPALAAAAAVLVWFGRTGHVTPFTAVIPAAGTMLIAGFVLFLLALMADMISVHRGLSEELLYLARQRMYARQRAAGVRAIAKSLAPDQAPRHPPRPGTQTASHDAAARAAADGARDTPTATDSA